MQKLCVFCGSNAGRQNIYAEAAAEVGRLLVADGIDLVYGGGSVGLMGIVADAVLEAGGEVIGVIPKFLATKELLHTGMTETRIVSSMHERKALMAELSDGFLMLPGGYGTFEEFFEAVTWAQLGLHEKPIGILNTGGYFAALLQFLDHTIQEEFVHPLHQGLILSAESPAELLSQMKTHQLPKVKKWLDADKT